MNEKIKQEVALAMKFISRLNVSGDAVDVVAAVRQALRNIVTICDGGRRADAGQRAGQAGGRAEKGR